MRYTSVTLAGVSGSQALEPISGSIEFVKVTFTNGNVAGDLTLADAVTGLSLLALSNTATNISAPLRQAAIGTDGTALSGADGKLPVVGGITATWAQHSANTSILVEVWWS